jgi:bacterioferritin
MTDLKKDEIQRELTTAYWMEMETVMNYVCNSVNLDGVRAEEVKKALATDVQEELGHAQTLARRIRELGGTVPGSLAFSATQRMLQPPAEATDVLSVIKGVIDAEDAAIRQYNKIIKLCDGVDYVTALAGEETHCREFRGFLAGYER